MCLHLCDVGGPSVMSCVGFVWAGLCEKSHAMHVQIEDLTQNLNPGQDTREQTTKRTHERRHEGTHEGAHQHRPTNQPATHARLKICTAKKHRSITHDCDQSLLSYEVKYTLSAALVREVAVHRRIAVQNSIHGSSRMLCTQVPTPLGHGPCSCSVARVHTASNAV